MEFASVCSWCNVIWNCDAKKAVEDIAAEVEPIGWDTYHEVLAIRRRLSNSNWVLEWSHQESNFVADLVAKFSLESMSCVFADEFSVPSLPFNIVDRLASEQLGSRLYFLL
ncbi:hypothetical protein FNV43_RR15260 [Rhamnella rubrinervis]|uniref:Uncharacterized protein n=1 Tax=Rhamnella rubrinervis TaxID=2594499 RepID=A0A8K0E6Z7_9ROSA|nr:hypothetical protein FNV43_RR15260 [Rhamnella rubrinervis]